MLVILRKSANEVHFKLLQVKLLSSFDDKRSNLTPENTKENKDTAVSIFKIEIQIENWGRVE